MRQIEITELPRHLNTLLTAVSQGEEIILTQDHQPVAKLVQLEPRKPRRKAGSAKGLIHLSADFNEPVDDFVEYMP